MGSSPHAGNGHAPGPESKRVAGLIPARGERTLLDLERY